MGTALGAVGMGTFPSTVGGGSDILGSGNDPTPDDSPGRSSASSPQRLFKKYLRYGLSVVLLLFATASACYKYAQDKG